MLRVTKGDREAPLVTFLVTIPLDLCIRAHRLFKAGEDIYDLARMGLETEIAAREAVQKKRAARRAKKAGTL